MKRLLILLLAIFGTMCPAQASERDAGPLLGRAIDDFMLRSHRGREWSLSDFDNKELVVVAYLGTECPLAKLYGPRLAKLHERFAERGVAFIGINANTQDSVTEIAAYAERYQVRFPLLKDVGNRVADAMGASRTPEVFLLDRDRTVRYHGRIDDQYGVGIAHDRVNRRDLAIAIEELLETGLISVPATKPVGCVIGRVKESTPVGDVTYSNQIARILNQRCVECHREGEIAPFTLTSYDDLIGWEDTILEVIEDQRMPPWNANPAHGEFRNDARLSDEEKKLVFEWVKNGMPEGDPAQLPEPPEFADGWRISEPDQIFPMREEPFAVPAEGVVDYQYFVVDPQWGEDKYIYAAEARPDNSSVVHHIIVYVIPGGDGGRPDLRKMLIGYAPGTAPVRLYDGMAMRVPAGSKLLFEMHYTPNGYEQTDRSYAGVCFIDKEDVTQLLKGRMAINTKFRIPPNAASHQVPADFQFGRDEMLLSMTPHMHLRGKSFRYEAKYPDGTEEVLLDVPKYDFNWQLKYELAEPKLMPKGTTILCTAAFDNSAGNVANPDPSKTVKWGDQSWEEMMIGFFTTLPAEPSKSATISTNVSVDPTGLWTWKRPSRGGKVVEESLSLVLKDDRLSGTLFTSGREVAIQDAVIHDDRLTFQIISPDNPEVAIDFEAKVTADKITGNAIFNLEAVGKSLKMPWFASRSAE